MKKLLAILLAWFSAFFNNVAYVSAPESEGYQPGMYYKLETGESMPDYRENVQVTNQLDSKSACTMSNYVAKRFDNTAESLRIYAKSGGDYSYWWQASTATNPCDTGSINSAASETSIPKGAVIIAPAACIRTTAATTKQSYPVSMTLEFTRNNQVYIVTITGLHCWACDAFRELPTLDGVPVIVHTYEDNGHAYSKGEVLGIAGNNCKITIVKKNSSKTESATWGEFFATQ